MGKGSTYSLGSRIALQILVNQKDTVRYREMGNEQIYLLWVLRGESASCVQSQDSGMFEDFGRQHLRKDDNI